MRRRPERGQTTAEYLGVLVLVAAIVTALVVAGPGQAIANAVQRAVCEAVGTTCGGERQPRAIRLLALGSLRGGTVETPSDWGEPETVDLGSRDLARQYGEVKVRSQANDFFKGARRAGHDLPSEDFTAEEFPNGNVRLSYFDAANNPGYGKIYVRELSASGAVMRYYKVNVSQNRQGEWEQGAIKWLKGGPDRFDGAISNEDGSLKDPPTGDECACSISGQGGRWVTDRDGNERWIEAPDSGEYPQPVEVVPGEGVDPEPIPFE